MNLAYNVQYRSRTMNRTFKGAVMHLKRKILLISFINIIAAFLALQTFADEKTQADAKVQSEKEKKKKDSEEFNDKILKSITDAIDFKKLRCNINRISGKIKGETSSIAYDISCFVVFAKNISFSLLNDEKDAGSSDQNKNQSKDRFTARINMFTKNMLLELRAVSNNGVGKVTLTFYDRDVSDKTKWAATPLIADLSSNLNSKVLEINLLSLDINHNENKTEQGVTEVDATCEAWQTVLNERTFKNEKAKERCFAKAILKEGTDPEISYGFIIDNPNYPAADSEAVSAVPGKIP